MNAPRRVSRALLSSLLVFSTACAGGGALQLGDVTPESVPALEAAHQASPADANAATRLGVGYLRANRLPEARAVLDTVTTRSPNDGIAAIYLGMTAEAQGDFPAARAAYERYVSIGRSNELKGAARQRLALIGRRELEFQARQSLAQEAALTQQPPDPGTIAVMPFGYTGTNAEIAPLSRGFAQLIVTDLAKSRQVRVLERERMQSMLDEMRLGEQQRADPATAVRSGRLLRAERVVQGSLADQGSDLAIAAAVVDVNTSGVAAPASQTGNLDRLFDLEKAIVYEIFTGLGITLTDAERAAIEQRPTQNLAAFLAWSRGLEAEDRGDYAGARDLFDQATRLDPSFAAAAQSSQQAGDLQAASTQSAGELDATVAQNAATETSAVTSDVANTALTNATNGVNPTTAVATDAQQTPNRPVDREPAPEVRGNDTPTRTTGTLTITIRRP